MKEKAVRIPNTTDQSFITKGQTTGMLQKTLSFVALCLAIFCERSAAIGLGNANTRSYIGGPLTIEVPVQTNSSDQLDLSCIHLAQSATKQSEDLPWLRNANLKLVTRGDRTILIISATSNPHPVLMLGIQINCGTVLRRDYTLLLNPAATTVETAQDTPFVASSEAPGTRLQSSEPAAPTKPKIITTSWADTARSLANRLYPGDISAQRRMARAILLGNAEKLQNLRSTFKRLPPGIELLIPALPASLPAMQDTGPSKEATKDHPSTQSMEAPPRPASGKTTVRNRLIVSSAGDDIALKLSSSIGSHQELSEEQRSRLRTEMQLIASLDEKIASQLELADRLRQLEAMQIRLKEDADRLEHELRAQQGLHSSHQTSSTVTLAAPAKQALAPAKSTPDAEWFKQNKTYLLGLLALSLVTISGILIGKKKRQYHDQPEPLITSEHSETDELAEHLATPLSEADIWPDEEGHAPPAGIRKHSNLDGALGTLTASGLGPASMLQIVEDDLEEHDSAVELAEIMMSFGRVHGAAQTLADFIRANPKQAVKPWIKLLEVYRAAEMRTEYEALVTQLNKTFNVRPTSWDEFEIARKAPESLENMPHIMARIDVIWGKRECQAFLHELLRDNRQGTRQGFPLAIIDEILLLLGILESQLGAYKPETTPGNTHQAHTYQRQTTLLSQATSVAPLRFDEPPNSSLSNLETPYKNETTKNPSSLSESVTQLDFELDMADLTKTLHLNLDELDNKTDQK